MAHPFCSAFEVSVDDPLVRETETFRFLADPFNRWLYPDAREFLAHFPIFAGCFVAPACQAGTLFAEKDFGAIAAWMRPGVTADVMPMQRLIEKTVRPEIHGDLYAVFEQMVNYHHKVGPCWHLPVIAADPVRQRQGLGSALMKYALQVCDRDGLGAYLESTNTANVSLYQRHGFEIAGEIQVGSAPTIRPMVRPAR